MYTEIKLIIYLVTKNKKSKVTLTALKKINLKMIIYVLLKMFNYDTRV